MSFFLPNFVYRYLFYVPLFLENQLIALHHLFYRCSWYYSEGYIIKETFLQHLPSAGSNFEAFWAHFGVSSSILERCSPSYLMKFCIDFVCITLTINVIEKVHDTYPSAVFLDLFWVYSSML